MFAHYYRRVRPDFATFFINSTAHLQHSYWRAFQPEAFTAKPDAETIALYGGAIRFGYRAMDRLLGKFMALADAHDATLVFMTALSQQPYLAAEHSGGKHFYRLRDVDALFHRFAIGPADIDPTMTHQYLARFDSEMARETARARLAQFHLPDGAVLFDINARTSSGLYFSCNVFTDTDPGMLVTAPDGETFRFGEVAYKIDATKSGRHHPAGALWFGMGKAARHADPVSILDIFPTTLDLLGIENPTRDRTGRSLVDQLAI